MQRDDDAFLGTPEGSDAQGPQDQGAGEMPAGEPTADQLAAMQAANLRDVTGAVQLYIAITSSIAPRIGTDAFKLYRNRLLVEAGNPSDPIEIMLIEQLALAHFHVGRLQLKSCATESGPLSIAYADAATRLTAEFRRSALALEEYRAKQAVRTQAAGNASKTRRKTPKPQKPRRKKPATKLETNRMEGMPQCLQDRMSSLREVTLMEPSLN